MLLSGLKNEIKDKCLSLSNLDYLKILLHPIILPFTVIPAWIKSLWAAKCLFQGQWSRYHGFHIRNTINNLFYRTQRININRYGRDANSPIIGLGNFSLSNWWHLPSVANYFYAYAGAVTTLLGTLILVFSHLVWLQEGEWLWTCIVTLTLFLSSTAYIMAFVAQNYQILSWMTIPIAFFGLLNGQLIISAIAFFTASSMGITSFVASVVLVFVYAVYYANIYLLLVLLPASFIVSFKLISLLIKGDLQKSLKDIGKLIGLVRVAVRYKRKSMKFGVFNVYFLLLYGVAIGLIWYGQMQAPLLLIAAYFLFLFNQRFVRFADGESMIIVFVMVATAQTLLMPFQWVSLLGLLVASNPSPAIFKAGGFAAPKPFKPFDVNELLLKIQSFLTVAPRTTVLFAFNDPNGKYENVFDGYGSLLEAPLVVAAEQGIHLFPDWYAVLETNYKQAPPIWGRALDEVQTNLAYWNAEYVIIYQDTGSDLAKKWLNSFEVISELDWGNFEFDDATAKSLVDFSKKLPKWWLLKRLKSEPNVF